MLTLIGGALFGLGFLSIPLMRYVFNPVPDRPWADDIVYLGTAASAVVGALVLGIAFQVRTVLDTTIAVEYAALTGSVSLSAGGIVGAILLSRVLGREALASGTAPAPVAGRALRPNPSEFPPSVQRTGT